MLSVQRRSREQVLEQARVQEWIWEDYHQLWQQLPRHQSASLKSSILSRKQELRTIAKEPQESITVRPGGVVGDSHFYPPIRLASGQWQRRYNEINLYTREELDRLNHVFETDAGAGHAGENCLVKGLDIDQLPTGSLLRVGTALLRVAGVRSFCWKYIKVFCGTRLISLDDKLKFDLERMGRATQCIEQGTIRAGDTIQVEHMGTGMSYARTQRRPPVFELFAEETSHEPMAAVD